MSPLVEIELTDLPKSYPGTTGLLSMAIGKFSLPVWNRLNRDRVFI